MRRILFILLGLALTLSPAAAEVWNDPGGVAVTAVSTPITFPRVMKTVAVLNDGSDVIYARIFECGETAAAAVARTDYTTGNIEIKVNTSRVYTHDKETESGLGYCAIALICGAAETATVRIEAK